MTYAAHLVPALTRLRDALAGAGVPASLDRASLPIPGAWVTPATAAGLTLSGAGHVRASVLLVVPVAGDLEALTGLAGLLDKALTVIDPDEDVDTSVVLPLNNNPHPAFRLVVGLDLEE